MIHRAPPTMINTSSAGFIQMSPGRWHGLQMTLQFLRALTALVRPYWVSEERWSARGLLAIIIATNLAIVYVNVLFSNWNNRFYNALQQHDLRMFSHELVYFCALAAVFIVLAVTRRISARC